MVIWTHNRDKQTAGNAREQDKIFTSLMPIFIRTLFFHFRSKMFLTRADMVTKHS